MNPEVESAVIAAAATLVSVGGTVIVAISAVQNARSTNKETIDNAHRDVLVTLQAAREAQLADRYSRALEQIGSANLDVRIGGIYALEGIALDSPARYHPTVMEVLSTFIREHSNAPSVGAKPQSFPDVQTALTVVGRRKIEHDIRHIDLHGANLTYMDLRHADLRNANLSGANFAIATLDFADFRNAILTGAHLTSLDLADANFAEADLTGVEWQKGVRVPGGWELDRERLLRRAKQIRGDGD
jgi:hypothetical protein